MRDHRNLQVPGSMEMDPIRLPELPKPSRTQESCPKPIFQNLIIYRKHMYRTNFLLTPLIPLKGPIGGEFVVRLA